VCPVPGVAAVSERFIALGDASGAHTGEHATHEHR
jgi:hypothetical protein